VTWWLTPPGDKRICVVSLSSSFPTVHPAHWPLLRTDQARRKLLAHEQHLQEQRQHQVLQEPNHLQRDLQLEKAQLSLHMAALQLERRRAAFVNATEETMRSQHGGS